MADLSRRLGFDTWVRKNADRKFLEKHSQFEKRMGVYPVPDRKDPDFQLVFQWFDDQLMHRLIPALAETLPGASLEARVDDDPIYDGDKLISWYSHKLTYKIASSPFVMTYWAPAMGARNRGEVESAKKVVHRFSSMQKKISDNTTNKIFIEQFLFKDNTPSAAMNSAIAPREVSGFIRNMAGPLVQHTSGYALWGAQDYVGSTLFNGFFTLGAQGWKFSGGASVVKSDNEHFAQLPKDSTIIQTVPFARDHFRPFAKSTTLRFRATGPGVVAATYAGATHTVKIKAGSQLVKLKFPVSSGDSDLSITSKSGEIKLTDVYLFTFTQISDVRNSLGKPGQHLPDIQALNKAIDAGVGLPSHLNANDKTLARANGVYSLEHSGGNWYAWTGPEVSAKLLAKSSSITVRGYIKPSMYDSANGCVLNAFVDNSKAASEVYKLDSPILLTVPVSPTQIGTPIDFRLSSNCAINPKNAGQGNDDRTLSFILNEIRAQ
jgi:hypothetical protein